MPCAGQYYYHIEDYQVPQDIRRVSRSSSIQAEGCQKAWRTGALCPAPRVHSAQTLVFVGLLPP